MIRNRPVQQICRTLVAAVLCLYVSAVACAAEPPAPDQVGLPLGYVERVGHAFGLDPQLLYAVIRAESNFDPRARSRAGAIGLMQLVPHFGAREAYQVLYGRDGIPTEEALTDPKVNLLLGTAYLKVLLTRYYGDIPHPGVRLATALAAYNWGPTNVNRHLQRIPATPEAFFAWLDRSAPRETRQYVRRVLHYYVGHRDAASPPSSRIASGRLGSVAIAASSLTGTELGITSP